MLRLVREKKLLKQVPEESMDLICVPFFSCQGYNWNDQKAIEGETMNEGYHYIGIFVLIGNNGSFANKRK